MYHPLKTTRWSVITLTNCGMVITNFSFIYWHILQIHQSKNHSNHEELTVPWFEWEMWDSMVQENKSWWQFTQRAEHLALYQDEQINKRLPPNKSNEKTSRRKLWLKACKSLICFRLKTSSDHWPKDPSIISLYTRH